MAVFCGCVMRTIIIMTVFTTLVSSTAFTQEPSGGSATIPNLTCTWVYPFCCGFLSPPSGPGPVRNKIREPQVVRADGRPWLPSANPPLVASTSQYVGDYANPILKPQAAEGKRERRHTDSDAPQPMLARRRALRPGQHGHADDPAAGQDRHPL
jgi:hypothetical protein